jgi:hypothetical protein
MTEQKRRDSSEDDKKVEELVSKVRARVMDDEAPRIRARLKRTINEIMKSRNLPAMDDHELDAWCDRALTDGQIVKARQGA